MTEIERPTLAPDQNKKARPLRRSEDWPFWAFPVNAEDEEKEFIKLLFDSSPSEDFFFLYPKTSEKINILFCSKLADEIEDGVQALDKARSMVTQINKIIRVFNSRAHDIALTQQIGVLSRDRRQVRILGKIVSSRTRAIRVVGKDPIESSAKGPNPRTAGDFKWGNMLWIAQNTNPTARSIVAYLQSRDIKDLYLAYEAILSSINPTNKKAAAKIIVRRGWATESELESFFQTANSKYRHHPPRPMTIREMPRVEAHLLIERLCCHYFFHEKKREKTKR